MDSFLSSYCLEVDGSIKLGLYCIYCNWITKNIKDMRGHLVKYHTDNAVCYILLEGRKEPKFYEEPRFKCENCSYYNRKEEGMDKHWNKYHEDEEIIYKKIEFDKSNPFPCEKCGNKYFNRLMATLHWKVTHGTENAQSGFKDLTQHFICGNGPCKESFPSYKDLTSHYELEATHKIEDINFIMVRQDVSSGYLEYVYPEEDIYKCDVYEGCEIDFGKNKYDVFYHHLDKHYDEQERFVSISHGKDGFASWEKVLLKSLFTVLINKLCMKKLFK